MLPLGTDPSVGQKVTPKARRGRKPGQRFGWVRFTSFGTRCWSSVGVCGKGHSARTRCPRDPARTALASDQTENLHRHPPLPAVAGSVAVEAGQIQVGRLDYTLVPPRPWGDLSEAMTPA